MTNREWILVVLDSIDEMTLKLRKVVRKIPDEELEDLHHSYYDDLGVNIHNNFKFMKLIITRRLPEKQLSCNRRMTDEELVKYLREHWQQMVSDIFKH